MDNIINHNAYYYHRYLTYYYLILLKLLGLAPYSVKITKNHQSLTFGVSYIGSIYNIFLIITTCVSNILALPYIYFPDNTAVEIQLLHLVGSILTFFGNLLSILVWLIFIVWQKDAVRLANNLMHVDITAMKCNGYIIEHNDKHFIAIIAINMIGSITLLLFHVLPTYTPFFTLYYIPVLICSWILIQYSLILIRVRQKFQNLNKTLLNFGPITTDYEFHKLFVNKVTHRQIGLSDILIIRRVHMVLCEICHEIMKYYSLPILLIVVYFGGSCIFSLYFIFLTFLNNTNSDHALAIRLGSILWLIMDIFDFTVITVSVTKTMHEVR